MSNVQTIIKGDDTYFNGVDLLGAINLSSSVDITGWKAEFILQGIVLRFEDISNGIIQPRFTANQTSTFNIGTSYATLILFDAENNRRTQFTDLPFKIVAKVERDGY
jgi:hypothetical protein